MKPEKMAAKISGLKRVSEFDQMKPFNDLTGRQFGFLVVAAHAGTHQHRRYWKVHCRLCGGSKVVAAHNLLCGRSKSCGCVGRAKARERMSTLMAAVKFEALKAQGMSDADAEAVLADYFMRLFGMQGFLDPSAVGAEATSRDEECIPPSGMQ
jgi:hypothetical protein